MKVSVEKSERDVFVEWLKKHGAKNIHEKYRRGQRGFEFFEVTWDGEKEKPGRKPSIDKGKILVMRSEGHSLAEIGRVVGCSRAYCHKVIKENPSGQLSVMVSSDKQEVRRQIEALKYQISRDTNNKDKQVHQAALRTLENSL